MSDDNDGTAATGIAKRVKQWLLRNAPDGAREQDTKRPGFLSYAGEWHALAVGLAAGLAAGTTGRWELAAAVVAVALGMQAGKVKGADPSVAMVGEVRSEPWYALGGVVIGSVAGLVLPGL